MTVEEEFYKKEAVRLLRDAQKLIETSVGFVENDEKPLVKAAVLAMTYANLELALAKENMSKFQTKEDESLPEDAGARVAFAKNQIEFASEINLVMMTAKEAMFCKTAKLILELIGYIEEAITRSY